MLVAESSILHDLRTIVDVLHQGDQLPRLLVSAELRQILAEVHQADLQLWRFLLWPWLSL